MNRLLQAPLSAYLLLSCAFKVSAHGGAEHAQIVVAPDADWPTRHMAGTDSHGAVCVGMKSNSWIRGASHFGL
jgi:hypothetical protein